MPLQAESSTVIKMPLSEREAAPTVLRSHPGSDRSHVVASDAGDDAAVTEFLEELSDRAANEDETASNLLDTLLSGFDTRAVNHRSGQGVGV